MYRKSYLSTNYARAGVPDYGEAVYDPALLSRRFRLPTNVRLWLIPDVNSGAGEDRFRTKSGRFEMWCPLYAA